LAWHMTTHMRRSDRTISLLVGLGGCVLLFTLFYSHTSTKPLSAPVVSRQVSPCIFRTSMRRFVAPVSRSFRDVTVGAKGKQMMRRGKEPGQAVRNIPPTPPVDPQNEEFVIFVRSKMQRTWLPMSMVKGGWQANAIIANQRNEFGKKLFGGALDDTLVRNIASAIYQDSDKIVQKLRSQIPQLKHTKQFEFGFKIRDRDVPDDWWKPEGITRIPPKEDIPKTPIENFGDWFQGSFGKIGAGMKA